MYLLRHFQVKWLLFGRTMFLLTETWYMFVLLLFMLGFIAYGSRYKAHKKLMTSWNFANENCLPVTLVGWSCCCQWFQLISLSSVSHQKDWAKVYEYHAEKSKQHWQIVSSWWNHCTHCPCPRSQILQLFDDWIQNSSRRCGWIYLPLSGLGWILICCFQDIG